MSATTLPDELRLLAPRLTEGLIAAIVAIQALIAHHFLRHPIFQPVINPLWHRLNRARRCLTRLTARIEAGKPLPISRAGQTHTRAPAAPGPVSPIPHTHGWLLKALAWHVAVHRNRLERLLAEPGMADLVIATPSLGRILRPLGHMLALPVPRKRKAIAPAAKHPLLPLPPSRERVGERVEPPPALSPFLPAVTTSESEAIPLRPRTVPLNTASPFRSLTLKREPYICTHIRHD